MTGDTPTRRWWPARRPRAGSGVAATPAPPDAQTPAVLTGDDLALRARAELLVIGAAVQIVLDEERRLKELPSLQ